MYLITKVGIGLKWGVYIFGCTAPQTLGEAFLFDVWEMGELNIFGVWKTGRAGGDIIRKYTFECGARPAGAASIIIFLELDNVIGKTVQTTAGVSCTLGVND